MSIGFSKADNELLAEVLNYWDERETMTAPNSTDDIDKILIDFGMNCYEAAKNIKDATPKDLKTYKAKEAIQAEVQRQVVAEVISELEWATQDYIHKIDLKERLEHLKNNVTALQQGDNGSTTLNGNTEHWSKELDD